MSELVNERFEIFKLQDQENGLFDLKFEVEGKPIYAHKFMLASVSEVFKLMISDIWNKGESIPITTNSYNDFYEFLTFIYSGKCKLNDENIFVMTDLSEFYQIKALQQKCDEYLSQKEYTSKNVLMFLDNLSNYYLPLFERTVSKAIIEKGINLVESEGFMDLSKDMIVKIVSLEDRFVSEERMFEKVYEWAENRANIKQNESIERVNLNDAIKTEISEFLPFIDFKKMNFNFLIKFVVKKGFILTSDELSDILEIAARPFVVYATVTNANGKSIKFMLPRDLNIIENIKSLKNCSSFSYRQNWIYWEKQFEKPSTPSSLKKRDGIEWYLTYFIGGHLSVMHHSLIEDQYLLAEVCDDKSGFEIINSCNIDIE